MTGDTADMVARIKSVLPPTWFPDSGSPVLDGLINGLASGLAQSYALLAYVKQQSRIATASGVWLDIIAGDFFPGFIVRRTAESDTSLRNRINLEMFRRKGTRPAMVQTLTDLTGRAPVIFEPNNTGDTGGYGTGGTMGYGVSGGYGSLLLPFQVFVTALRPLGTGIPTVAAYASEAGSTLTAPGGYPGGYGAGAVEYGSLAFVATDVADTDILNALNDVRPAATVAWVRITSALSTPTPPGAVTGLVAA
jgi:hypothetical protein